MLFCTYACTQRSGSEIRFIEQEDAKNETMGEALVHPEERCFNMVSIVFSTWSVIHEWWIKLIWLQDPYFPHGVIDLRYVISCEAVNEKEFQVRTTQKIVHLQADSVPSRDEWVKSIHKVMFKAQNLGDTVKVRSSKLILHITTYTLYYT